MPESIEEVLPEVLMNSVLGKLYDVLTNGDDTVPKSEDNYLAWVTPGIPYSPEELTYMTEGLGGVYRKPENAEGDDEGESGTGVESVGTAGDSPYKRYFDAETFARLVDMIPDTSGIKGVVTENVWNAERTLSNTYRDILTFSQVAHYELEPATIEKIDKLRGLLQVKRMEKDLIDETIEREVVEDSPLTKAYYDKMQNYITATLEYNTHRISALSGDPQAVHFWSINAPVLRSKVNMALRDWVANGYKEKYEQITSFISQVEGRSMEVLKARYIDEFQKATLTGVDSGTDFIYSRLIPASFAKSSNGWTEFEFNKSSFDSEFDFSNKKGGGSIGLNLGLVRFGGGGGAEKQNIENKVKTSKFKLTFKLAQVPIWRAGINTQFLVSKYWRFDEGNPDFKGQMVSDGKRPPSGILPAYTTACIFVKDLKLEFSESDSTFKELKNKAGGGGFFGYGPFHLGGRYSSGKVERDFEQKTEGQSIMVPGMQLIGFKCHILPKSPDPNPEIKNWGA